MMSRVWYEHRHGRDSRTRQGQLAGRPREDRQRTEAIDSRWGRRWIAYIHDLLENCRRLQFELRAFPDRCPRPRPPPAMPVLPFDPHPRPSQTDRPRLRFPGADPWRRPTHPPMRRQSRAHAPSSSSGSRAVVIVRGMNRYANRARTNVGGTERCSEPLSSGRRCRSAIGVLNDTTDAHSTIIVL